jgi:hypothetical protein
VDKFFQTLTKPEESLRMGKKNTRQAGEHVLFLLAKPD